MNRVLLLSLLLSPLALADSISIGGTCSTNPCTEYVTDQYGDPWAYVQLNISSSAGHIAEGVALTPAFLNQHPDAVPDAPLFIGPYESFTSTWTLPTAVDGTLNVFFEEFGGSDDQGSTPSVRAEGLPNDGVPICCTDFVEYTNVAPGTVVTFEGSLSLEEYDSSGFLNWDAYFEVMPAPEPASWGLGLLALLGFGAWRLYVFMSVRKDAHL